MIELNDRKTKLDSTGNKQLFTKSLSDYIEEDNKETLKIYNALFTGYLKSLSIYPKENNLLGVYFFDVLKLLTLSHLKKREINNGIEPRNKILNRTLETFPYIGYEDIKNGCDIDSKRFGKGLTVTQSYQRRVFQSIVNLQFTMGRKASAKVSLLSPMIDSGCNLWLESPHIKTNLINYSKSLFAFPQLEDQLINLKSLISELIENCKHLMPPKILTDLLYKHVLADCSEGNPKIHIDGDVLLLKCGIELQNRMLAIAARVKGRAVINIMHGEAFGVYDEPIFSELGEQMYSTAILGFGSKVLNNSHPYQYGIKNGLEYIESNGVNVLKHYKHEISGINSKLPNVNFFYYPTTFSGTSYRYGPFRDTADSLYIKWQNVLLELFGNTLKIKLHPKEKFSEYYSLGGGEKIRGDFDELLSGIDVFVFDYISTAFNIACATNKPIIYFDLGIRRIHIEALDEIKIRTIYFSIKDGIPTIDEVMEQLRYVPRENNYSKNYSLKNNAESRSKSLSDGIKKLLA